MLDIMIAGVAYTVNLIMSFITNGDWKTAGSGLVYLYRARASGPVPLTGQSVPK
jgi:hypothetical protein